MVLVISCLLNSYAKAELQTGLSLKPKPVPNQKSQALTRPETSFIFEAWFRSESQIVEWVNAIYAQLPGIVGVAKLTRPKLFTTIRFLLNI